LAVKKGWMLHQLDVNNAFLHRDLHEEIYMRLPRSVHTDVPNAVCKLNKSLHGLKQASRQWYAKVRAVLYQRGDKHSENDYSLFFKLQQTSVVFLAVYVDDIRLIKVCHSHRRNLHWNYYRNMVVISAHL